MRYRWKQMDKGYTEAYLLYLIVDDAKYEAAEVTWYGNTERWVVFVSGYVCEDKVHVEGTRYELLCDAKRDVMDYMKVWWVTGEFQRLSEHERDNWRNL